MKTIFRSINDANSYWVMSDANWSIRDFFRKHRVDSLVHCLSSADQLRAILISGGTIQAMTHDEYREQCVQDEWESMQAAERSLHGIVIIEEYDHEWELAERVAKTLKH